MIKMKKYFSLVALLSMIALGQSAFAWTSDGIGSLNQFTNFGRGFGGNDCACQKVQDPCCEKQQPKCGKRHLTFGCPAGYAVPVYVPCECAENGAVPIIYDEQNAYENIIMPNNCNRCNNYVQPKCNNCQRAY